MCFRRFVQCTTIVYVFFCVLLVATTFRIRIINALAQVAKFNLALIVAYRKLNNMATHQSAEQLLCRIIRDSKKPNNQATHPPTTTIYLAFTSLVTGILEVEKKHPKCQPQMQLIDTQFALPQVEQNLRQVYDSSKITLYLPHPLKSHYQTLVRLVQLQAPTAP